MSITEDRFFAVVVGKKLLDRLCTWYILSGLSQKPVTHHDPERDGLITGFGVVVVVVVVVEVA